MMKLVSRQELLPVFRLTEQMLVFGVKSDGLVSVGIQVILKKRSRTKIDVSIQFCFNTNKVMVATSVATTKHIRFMYL